MNRPTISRAVSRAASTTAALAAMLSAGCAPAAPRSTPAAEEVTMNTPPKPDAPLVTAPTTDDDPRPPIDRDAPAEFETATFALG